MDNRIDEFNEMINKADNISATVSSESLRKKVKSRARVRRIGIACRNTGIACAAFFAIIIAGVNMSPAFAKTLENIPVLRKIAEKVTVNKGYSEAIDNGYLTEIRQVAKNKITNLELGYAMGDDDTLVLFLKSTNNEIEGSITIRKINGEKPDFSYLVGDVSKYNQAEYEGYTIMVLYWNQFVRDNSIELEFTTIDGESAIFKYEFSLREELETREIMINKTIRVREQSVVVEKVKLHPLTTEIIVKFDKLNQNEKNEVQDMVFELVDENGSVESIKNGRYMAWSESDKRISVFLDSGYFSLGKNVKLVIKNNITGELIKEINL